MITSASPYQWYILSDIALRLMVLHGMVCMIGILRKSRWCPKTYIRLHKLGRAGRGVPHPELGQLFVSMGNQYPLYRSRSARLGDRPCAGGASLATLSPYRLQCGRRKMSKRLDCEVRSVNDGVRSFESENRRWDLLIVVFHFVLGSRPEVHRGRSGPQSVQGEFVRSAKSAITSSWCWDVRTNHRIPNCPVPRVETNEFVSSTPMYL